MGVTVPDPLGEFAFDRVDKDVVDAKRFESDALLRRYGKVVSEDNGDLFGGCLVLGTLMLSESDSCGDCRGSFAGGIREA